MKQKAKLFMNLGKYHSYDDVFQLFPNEYGETSDIKDFPTDKVPLKHHIEPFILI